MKDVSNDVYAVFGTPEWKIHGRTYPVHRNCCRFSRYRRTSGEKGENQQTIISEKEYKELYQNIPATDCKFYREKDRHTWPERCGLAYDEMNSLMQNEEVKFPLECVNKYTIRGSTLSRHSKLKATVRLERGVPIIKIPALGLSKHLKQRMSHWRPNEIEQLTYYRSYLDESDKIRVGISMRPTVNDSDYRFTIEVSDTEGGMQHTLDCH